MEIASIAPLFQPDWTEKMAVNAIDVSMKEPRRPEHAGRAMVFLGKGARECVLRRPGWLERGGILHFACHGIADDVSPADASLILTTQDLPDDEDGFLTASEVMGIRTHARAVVLSACETGLGEILRGEGVQGLTRAWQFAGARTVVVSLWKVEDRATANFMMAFYTALTSGKGMSVTKALAVARRNMASSVKHGAPVYWAAFTCHGER